jgi:beta-barrel assembly-enhancing protease
MRLSRNLAIGILGCVPLAMIHTAVQSTPAPTSEPLVPIATEVAQVKQAKPDAFYQAAKKKLTDALGERLGNDYYTLYRIVERLARANGLDNRPWRVAIPQTYDINAFATNVNLLAFYNGLLDQIDGDPDAIACVAAHEMAHHTQKHIPVGKAQRERTLQQLRQEAVDEVAAENADLKADLDGLNIGAWVNGNVGQIVGSGSAGGLLTNVIGGVIQGNRQRRLRKAAKRIEEISAEKEAKLRNEWRELSHRHELEADKFGYIYMVRAGFKPQGCITLLNVLEQLPDSHFSSDTHPLTSDRIAAINALSAEYPTAKLVNEGKAKLAANAKPLTYDVSRDDVSLRINSRAGSSNIDQRLPQ